MIALNPTLLEAQGYYPFKQRSVEMMLKHLPAYLREVITEFQAAPHSGALHRFWIEAEELDMSIDEQGKDRDGIVRIGLDTVKMVVKKHRMTRDIHGNLQDVGSEDEGWPIYVLTAAQMQELEQRKQSIDGHAMIFIYGAAKIYYWEHHAVVQTYCPTKEHRESLIRLYSQPREADGKVIVNTKNMPLIYRVTTTMAQLSGMLHRYSPEFIFAHKFTIHYDEFAQYLPEFGRLKELSKISTLVRFLGGIRRSNKESLEALDLLLNGPPLTGYFRSPYLGVGYSGFGSESTLPYSSQAPRNTDSYRMYKERRDKLHANIITVLGNLKKNTSYWQQKWYSELSTLRKTIGKLACDVTTDDGPDLPLLKIWQHTGQSYGIEELKTLKTCQENWRKELYKKYAPQLLPYFSGENDYNEVIVSFLRRNIKPLAEALIKHEINKEKEAVHKQLPGNSIEEISEALINDDTIRHFADQESSRQLRQQREESARLAEGFAQIHLGPEEKEDEEEKEKVNLAGECLWVPATVRHETRKESTTGQNRYSFFVYGGVNLQPRINIIQGGNGPLGGSRVGGGSFNRADITRGLQSHHIISPTNQATKNHELLTLAGFNNKKEINSRVNRIFLPVNRSDHPTRSIHIGKHTQEAMDNVAKKMDNIVKMGRAQNWSQSQYRSELRTMLSETRQELRGGKVALNKVHVPPTKNS